MMIDKSRIQSCVDHINTALDVDPWAKELVAEMGKEILKAQLSGEGTTSDCISRRGVIDALEKVADLFPWRVPGKSDTYDSYNEAWNDAIGRAEMEIEKLPSVQPDIVRCKDCKHWMPYDWMYSEVWLSKNIDDYPEDEIGCTYCDMNMGANDFCSRAERKTDEH